MEPERPDDEAPWQARPAEGDLELWEAQLGSPDQHSLVDLVNRVLDRGVVITGDITISVAGVDLVYLGLNAILTSVSTAREVLGRRVGRGDGSGSGA